MSNEMVVYSEEEKALMAGFDLGVGGEENLQPGDVGMPPRLRISQPNRPVEIGGEEVTPGHIVNTMTGESGAALEFVPLMFLPRTMVMWPETYNADNAPECLSDDGKMPTTTRDATNPQPGPCASCPMSQFIDGQKPRCTMQRNFLVWLTDSQEPAIITMQSTALKEAKKLTALAKMQGVKKTIRFETAKVKDDRGSWFVPAISRGRTLAIKEIFPIVDAKAELQNLIITADTAEYDVEDLPDSGSFISEEDDIPF